MSLGIRIHKRACRLQSCKLARSSSEQTKWKKKVATGKRIDWKSRLRFGHNRLLDLSYWSHDFIDWLSAFFWANQKLGSKLWLKPFWAKACHLCLRSILLPSHGRRSNPNTSESWESSIGTPIGRSNKPDVTDYSYDHCTGRHQAGHLESRKYFSPDYTSDVHDSPTLISSQISFHSSVLIATSTPSQSKHSHISATLTQSLIIEP